MKLRPFELALVIIFSLLALFALVLLTTYKPAPDEEETLLQTVGQVDIWGTLPSAGMESLLAKLSKENEAYLNVFYEYYHPDDFDRVLTNALADGVGPDLVIMAHEKLVDSRKRIQPVSFEFFSVRDVRNNYVDGAQIFALSDGMYGYPIAVDPLMMYWNKDILATEGYLDAPKTWEELVNVMFTDIIKRDFDRTIRRSVVALGEYSNIRNGFGIISALLLQAGSQTVTENSQGNYLVTLQSSDSSSNDPLRAAVDFYTRFSKPSNALYSWNRSFSEDRKQFVSEDLALYFGYGSEGPQIEQMNPNLNFDIAEIPQGSSDSVRRTYGKFYAISLLKSSDNIQGAAQIMSNFGSQKIADEIAVASSMAPAYRLSASQGSNDVYGRLTYKSAGTAMGWLNPNLDSANDVFERMTQDINENRRDLDGAVTDASSRLQAEY